MANELKFSTGDVAFAKIEGGKTMAIYSNRNNKTENNEPNKFNV